MSQEVASRRLSTPMHSSWTSVAFIVESILLLLFLVASLAILTQVFFSSLNRSVESRTLDVATIAASSIAEHFAADPSDIAPETQLGDLKIVCTVSEEPRPGGTMHYAHIEVFNKGEGGGSDPVYSLDTSSYQPGGDHAS